jgi:hypothetical protein
MNEPGKRPMKDSPYPIHLGAIYSPIDLPNSGGKERPIARTAFAPTAFELQMTAVNAHKSTSSAIAATANNK